MSATAFAALQGGTESSAERSGAEQSGAELSGATQSEAETRETNKQSDQSDGSDGDTNRSKQPADGPSDGRIQEAALTGAGSSLTSLSSSAKPPVRGPPHLWPERPGAQRMRPGKKKRAELKRLDGGVLVDKSVVDHDHEKHEGERKNHWSQNSKSVTSASGGASASRDVSSGGDIQSINIDVGGGAAVRSVSHGSGGKVHFGSERESTLSRCARRKQESKRRQQENKRRQKRRGMTDMKTELRAMTKKTARMEHNVAALRGAVFNQLQIQEQLQNGLQHQLLSGSLLGSPGPFPYYGPGPFPGLAPYGGQNQFQNVGNCGPQEGGNFGPQKGGSFSPQKGGGFSPQKGIGFSPQKGGGFGNGQMMFWGPPQQGMDPQGMDPQGMAASAATENGAAAAAEEATENAVSTAENSENNDIHEPTTVSTAEKTAEDGAAGKESDLRRKSTTTGDSSDDNHDNVNDSSNTLHPTAMPSDSADDNVDSNNDGINVNSNNDGKDCKDDNAQSNKVSPVTVTVSSGKVAGIVPGSTPGKVGAATYGGGTMDYTAITEKGGNGRKSNALNSLKAGPFRRTNVGTNIGTSSGRSSMIGTHASISSTSNVRKAANSNFSKGSQNGSQNSQSPGFRLCPDAPEFVPNSQSGYSQSVDSLAAWPALSAPKPSAPKSSPKSSASTKKWLNADKLKPNAANHKKLSLLNTKCPAPAAPPHKPKQPAKPKQTTQHAKHPLLSLDDVHVNPFEDGISPDDIDVNPFESGGGLHSPPFDDVKDVKDVKTSGKMSPLSSKQSLPRKSSYQYAEDKKWGDMSSDLLSSIPPSTPADTVNSSTAEEGYGENNEITHQAENQQQNEEDSSVFGGPDHTEDEILRLLTGRSGEKN